jgi:hypothetical protein
MGDLLLKAREDKKELGFRPEVGQRVWMTFVQDAVHLFDKETERRLSDARKSVDSLGGACVG